MNSYIDVIYYETNLKQKLANLIGRQFHDLSSLTVADLLHEVEVQRKDYIHVGNAKYLHHDVEEAYMYIYMGYPFN